MHRYIIDMAIVFMDSKFCHSLKTLVKRLLHKEIQSSNFGHDSYEDAACLHGTDALQERILSISAATSTVTLTINIVQKKTSRSNFVIIIQIFLLQILHKRSKTKTNKLFQHT